VAYFTITFLTYNVHIEHNSIKNMHIR